MILQDIGYNYTMISIYFPTEIIFLITLCDLVTIFMISNFWLNAGKRVIHSESSNRKLLEVKQYLEQKTMVMNHSGVTMIKILFS